jgi:hypothetical protein
MFTGFALYYFLKINNIKPKVTAVSVILFLFNPVTVFLSLSGLETPLLFLLVMLQLIFIKKITDENTPSLKLFILFGVCTGFLTLTRTDFAVYSFFSVIYLFIKLRKKLEVKRVIKMLIVSCAAALVVFSPWMLWNLFTFKTIFQSSTLATSIQYHKRYLIEYNTDTYLSPKLFKYFWEKLVYSVKMYFFIFTRNKAIVNNNTVLGLLFVIFMPLFIFRKKLFNLNKTKDDGFNSILNPLKFYIIFAVIFYIFIRWFFQTWHFSVFFLFSILYIAYLLNNFKITFSKRAVNIFIAVFFIVNICLSIVCRKNGFWKYQSIDLKNTIALRNNKTLDGKKIGTFDAGILAYFLDKTTVVNLDGVVNNIALKYVKNNNLQEYIEKQQFDAVLSVKIYSKIFNLDPERFYIHKKNR